MTRFVDSSKVVEWRRRLRRFQSTQGSIAAFCHDEGVSTASFYLWRRKLAQEEQVQPRDGLRNSFEAPEPRANFAPVRLVGAQTLAVWFPGGTRVEIPVADPRLVDVAIQALMRADTLRTTDQQARTQAGGATC